MLNTVYTILFAVITTVTLFFAAMYLVFVWASVGWLSSFAAITHDYFFFCVTHTFPLLISFLMRRHALLTGLDARFFLDTGSSVLYAHRLVIVPNFYAAPSFAAFSP